MKSQHAASLCILLCAALFYAKASAEANLPPPSPPPLCIDPGNDTDPNKITYRYHSEVGPSSSVSQIRESQPHCSGFGSPIVNELPDGTFEYFVTSSVESGPIAYMNCNATGQAISCEASPTTGQTKLSYTWLVSGNLQFSISGKQDPLLRSMMCMPGQGSGTISLRVTDTINDRTGWAHLSVICTETADPKS